MKSRGYFTYPSKICIENGVECKGYCRNMMTSFDLIVLRTKISLQHIAERRVFLSIQPRMNILQLRRKQVKIPKSNEEYDPEELYWWRWRLYSYQFRHWIRRDALAGHTDTVLCDLCCKNTCWVFSIMSKIGTGPRNQTMKLYTLAETPTIQGDKDQDGVYQTNKDKYLNCHFLYI